MAPRRLLHMIFIVVVVVVPLLLGLLAVRFGADSRDGRDWQPRDTNAARSTSTSLH